MAKKSSEPKFPVNRELEAAVIARAEEDAPRLMYADWLDDHGDPDRAAFIRTQVALWDKNPADADYVELLNRAEELDSLYVYLRLEPKLPKDFSVSDPFVSDKAFRRGFPFFVSCPDDLTKFKKALPFIFGQTTIRGFGPSTTQLDLLSTDPYRLQVQALELDYRGPRSAEHDDTLNRLLSAKFGPTLQWVKLGTLGPEPVARFARTDNTLRPRRVTARFRDLQPANVSRFLSSEAMSGVRWLEPDFEVENAVAAKALARLPELHTLEFWRNSANTVPELVRGGRYPALARLFLYGVPLRGAGVQSLTKAKMPHLSVLECSGCGLQNRDVLALTNSPVFDRLQVLSFSSDSIGDSSIRAIAKSDSANTLQSLSLSGSNLVNPGLRAIATAFPALRTFRTGLTKSQLDHADVAQFLRAMTCDQLQVMELDFPLDDEGALALANNAALTSLRKLWFERTREGDNAVTTRGLTALFTSKVLSNLVQLSVRSKNPNNAAELLLDRTVLPNLRRLELNVNDGLRQRLRTARPNLYVHVPIW